LIYPKLDVIDIPNFEADSILKNKYEPGSCKKSGSKIYASTPQD